MADYDSLPETSWKIKQPPDDDRRDDAMDAGGLCADKYIQDNIDIQCYL